MKRASLEKTPPAEHWHHRHHEQRGALARLLAIAEFVLQFAMGLLGLAALLYAVATTVGLVQPDGEESSWLSRAGAVVAGAVFMYWGFGMAYRVLRDALSGPLLYEGRVDHVEERMVGERIQYAELVLTSGDQTWRITPPPRVSVGDTVRVSYLAGTEQVCDLWVKFIPLPEG